MSLKRILRKIEEELKERKDIKDELYDAMRKATRFSKQAIFLVHKGEFEEAEKMLGEAERLLVERDQVSLTHQKLAHAGIVDVAFQEYAEAYVFLQLVQNGRFVTPEKIKVPSTSYLLGLADVVGELRRKVLDSLREGDGEGAQKNFEIMDFIYNELIGIDEALHSVSELRRKTDIARRIVELTRGDITIEARRNSLERSIRSLEDALKEK